MAAKKHLELFFERFLAFNLNRYKDDATSLAYFTGLTFPDIAMSDIVALAEPNRFSATVTSTTRRFRGANQSWTAADAATDVNLWALKNTTPLASVDELSEQTVAGVYSYVGAEGKTTVGVVIPEGIEDAGIDAAVRDVINAAAQYETEGSSASSATNIAAVRGRTFKGDLVWAAALIPMLTIPDTDYGQLAGAVVAP